MQNEFSQWQILLDGHCHHWLGLWARYTPSGELIESYPSERIFVANSSMTSAHQTNIHHKSDGDIINEWDLHREADWALYHPHCRTMCNFYLSDRTVFWVPLKSATEFFGIEIILTWETSRVSVFATYDSDRQLSRFTLVREYRKDTLSIWSNNLTIQNLSQISKVFTSPSILGEYGKGESLIESMTSEWLTGAGRSIIYFPDNIGFNVPTYLDPSNPSDLIVDWLAPTGKIERRIVRYQLEQEFPLFFLQRN